MKYINLISNFAEFKELKSIDNATLIGVLEDVFRHALQKQFESDENFDVIITATGVPHLIKSEYIKPGAVVVDAGTASEKGVLMGDVDEAVRNRKDLAALTPKLGGVGPLTVSVLFENVIFAAGNQK